MVMSYKAGPELGMIEVHTTSEGGHPTEFWAKLCILNKIEIHFIFYNLWIKNHIYLNTKLG